MAGVEVLFFCLGAAVGFAAYACLGWDRYPGRRTAEILTPRCAWIILAVAAGTLIAVAYVVFVTALPGEPVYKAEVLLRAFFVEVFLGFAFGLGFGIWVNYFFVPNALAGAHARAVHLRWGIALLALLLTGVLMGPASRLLPYLTGISIPVVSLDFTNRGQNEPEREVVIANSGSVAGSRSADIAESYLAGVADYLARDHSYARLLHGEPSDELEMLQERASMSVTPIAQCFAIEIGNRKYWGDPGAIHTEFGRALAASGTWLRSVLAANAIDSDRTSRTAFAEMYSGLPDCSGFLDLWDYTLPFLTSETSYELPYLTLAVAHMMQLAGYGGRRGQAAGPMDRPKPTGRPREEDP